MTLTPNPHTHTLTSTLPHSNEAVNGENERHWVALEVTGERSRVQIQARELVVVDRACGMQRLGVGDLIGG